MEVPFSILSVTTHLFGLNINFLNQNDELQEALIKAEKDKAVIADKLAKYLPPRVYRSIFTGSKDVKIESYPKKLTVFFFDIQNFTKTTDSMESEALTSVLNEYLNEMSKIALEHGRTIDKYIGDAIVIFFGDPELKRVKEDALACANMALAMRERLKTLRENWLEHGVANPLHVHLGINTGFHTVGNIGWEVNLASWLESLAQEDSIPVSYETYALKKDRIKCEERRQTNVNGIAFRCAFSKSSTPM